MNNNPNKALQTIGAKARLSLIADVRNKKGQKSEDSTWFPVDHNRDMLLGVFEGRNA